MKKAAGISPAAGLPGPKPQPPGGLDAVRLSRRLKHSGHGSSPFQKSRPPKKATLYYNHIPPKVFFRVEFFISRYFLQS
jgi:hypothetical protein